MFDYLCCRQNESVSFTAPLPVTNSFALFQEIRLKPVFLYSHKISVLFYLTQDINLLLIPPIAMTISLLYYLIQDLPQSTIYKLFAHPSYSNDICQKGNERFTKSGKFHLPPFARRFFNCISNVKVYFYFHIHIPCTLYCKRISYIYI